MNQDQMTFILPEDEPLDPVGELSEPIQIVDLFAGPGGLGEGFTSLGEGNRFEIVVSAEKDPKAWQTLRLRAFYRLLKKHKSSHLHEYYDFCNDPSAPDVFLPSEETAELWERSADEARCITLGSVEGNRELDDALNAGLRKDRPWVLIGGPPCQAYSLAGRSRNQANANYKAEEDHRHFLYKEYLRIIRERQPSVFVMENVKGILSSKVNDERIFSNILKDLSDPHQALHESGSGKRYHIYSLVTGAHFSPNDNVDKIDPRAFVIKAEEYGIPQARHRVILLGISEDCLPESTAQIKLSRNEPSVSVAQIIGDLPRLRSKLTKTVDSTDNWTSVIQEQASYLQSKTAITDTISTSMWKSFTHITHMLTAPDSHGGKRVKRNIERSDGDIGIPQLNQWFHDPELGYWLNHEVRGHMQSDLRRYLFASVYAEHTGASPKGHKDFNLEGLAPDHKNWKSGVFSDRFRVQLKDKPATTITSHISKDGHYFIHYDPTQCRSLSVREAARIQTFPDNYFFQGNRTEQFHQVGNAVPPLLASKIAKVVFRLLFDKIKSYDELNPKPNKSKLPEPCI
ncbi:DNA cytosine methyltransferase [Pseudomonas ovata]|uniref:DNA cytosine methyltransferase n=1 Tax=Pseudomonas ovata TaxID=1839709 RepID=UPI001F4E1B6D|nr:DNA (cytosine-5-)-methyltransferase [Pseudomonas ovata]